MKGLWIRRNVLLLTNCIQPLYIRGERSSLKFFHTNVLVLFYKYLREERSVLTNCKNACVYGRNVPLFNFSTRILT